MYGRSFLTLSYCTSGTKALFLRFLPLLEDLLVSRWLLNALLLFIFPVPVTLKRLAAPLWVLSLGISFLLSLKYKVKVKVEVEKKIPEVLS
jgi:hypothetical protein